MDVFIIRSLLPICFVFLKCFTIHGFIQLNNVFSTHNSLLDLVILNNYSISVAIALAETAALSDFFYPPLLLSLNNDFLLPLFIYCTSSFYILNKLNFSAISSFFTSFNWDRTFSTYSADETITDFYEAFHYSISVFIPFVNVNNPSFPFCSLLNCKNLF